MVTWLTLGTLLTLLTMATTDVLITADTRELVRTLEDFVALTGREARQVAGGAMKSMVADVIAITPPGTTTKESAAAAKRRGERTVEGDIRRIIKPDAVLVGKPGRSTLVGVQAIKAFHQANRSKSTGKVKGGRRAGLKRTFGNRVMSAPPADVERYIRAAKKKVGILRSGWGAAAGRFGVPVPAWVRKHGGAGSVFVRHSGLGIEIQAENAVRYARGLRDIQRRIDWVVATQQAKTERQMAAILSKRVGSLSF